MKLNFGRRLVLFVHWLMSLAACALAVALIVWPDCRETAANLLGDMTVVIYAIAVLAVYLLFSVGTVCIALGGRNKGGDHGFIIVDSSETGRTRIAVVAVEQMIRQAVRGVPGITQMKAGINNGGDSISIDVDVTILNGTHVPTVTANIQRAIRSYIELNCGVAVRGVSVSVHSLTETEQTGRRGRRKGAAQSAEPIPAYSIVTAPAAAEPASVRVIEDAPVFVKEPEPVVPSEPEPVPVEEPASEPEKVEEEIAPAPKKGGFFKGLFGRRGAKAGQPEEPEEPAVEPEQPEVEEIVHTEAEEIPEAEEPVIPEFRIGDAAEDDETEE